MLKKGACDGRDKSDSQTTARRGRLRRARRTPRPTASARRRRCDAPRSALDRRSRDRNARLRQPAGRFARQGLACLAGGSDCSGACHCGPRHGPCAGRVEDGRCRGCRGDAHRKLRCHELRASFAPDLQECRPGLSDPARSAAARRPEPGAADPRLGAKGQHRAAGPAPQGDRTTTAACDQPRAPRRPDQDTACTGCSAGPGQEGSRATASTTAAEEGLT
jgi:hypothetical protein